MSSKRRLRRHQCTRKIRFATLDAAQAASRNRSYKTKSSIGQYKCKFCGGFHVGHAPQRVVHAIMDGKK